MAPPAAPQNGNGNGSPQMKALSWLFGQPVYIVLLTACLVAVWHYLNYSQPALIERLDASHATERKEMREDARQAHEKFGTIIDKFSETVSASSRAIERLNDRLETKK